MTKEQAVKGFHLVNDLRRNEWLTEQVNEAKGLFDLTKWLQEFDDKWSADLFEDLKIELTESLKKSKEKLKAELDEL